MNRRFSPRTQGILLVVIGAVAVIAGVLLEVSGQLDSYAAWKTPVMIVVGVVAVSRFRGKITN